MIFRNQTDLDKFLSDEKYYAGLDNYCLGNSLEDAGEIIRKIMEDSENVGMAASGIE